MQQEVLRYRQEGDRRRVLLGRLLLARGLSRFGMPDPLAAFERDGNGRPRIAGAPDFNISHSGEMAACAFGADGLRVGLDLEAAGRQLRPDDFSRYFPPEIWERIAGGADPVRSFLGFWTRAESALKAHGTGLLHGRLSGLVYGDGFVEIDGLRWFTRSIVLAAGYEACLACRVRDVRLSVEDASLAFARTLDTAFP